MKRKIFSFLLTVCMILTMLPVTGGVETAEAASKGLSLYDLQKKFPHESYWNRANRYENNQDGYTNEACKHKEEGYIRCNDFIVGNVAYSSQCMGYAEKLGYDATGYNPRNNANGWYTYPLSKSSSLDNLKPGDIVQYYSYTYTDKDGIDRDVYHSIYVTDVDGDTITYTDCNGDSHCGIRWGAETTKKVLRTKFVTGSHIRVAPFETPEKAGYLPECDEPLPCHAMLTTTRVDTVYKLPCNLSTAAKFGYAEDNGKIKAVKAGDTFEAVALIKNTEGNYWYKVVWTENGTQKEGYLYSGCVLGKTPPKLLWDDLEFENISAPTKISLGHWFYLKGTIKSTETELTSVQARILTLDGNVACGLEKKEYVSGSYKLDDSDIDEAIWFPRLKPAGIYIYELSATARSYYATGVKTISAPQEYTRIETYEFTVGDPPPVKHTVYFYDMHGDVLKEVVVTRHSTLGTLPKAPSRLGYNFSHWRCGDKAVSANTTVTGDMYIYPEYIAKTYKVILDTLIDSSPLIKNVIYGNVFDYLPMPTRPGYQFLGWYTAKTGGEMVKSDTLLQAGGASTYSMRSVNAGLPIDDETQTLTLYARWSLQADSGRCGENLTWEVDEDGVLTISGHGSMYGYVNTTVPSDFPWDHIREDITKVVLPNGLTSIPNTAFTGLKKLESVEIPHTVGYVGDSAFSGCTSLEEVTFYGDQPSNLDKTTFKNCDAELTIHKRADAEWSDVDYSTKEFSCTHEYENNVVMPTCVDGGYTEHTCNRCGTKYVDNYTAATGIHEYTYSSYPFDDMRDRIGEFCTSGCDHYAYARVTIDYSNDKFFYYGEPLTPGLIYYSDDWKGGPLTVKYKNNNGEGSAKAYIEKEGATGFAHFSIVIPQNLVEGAEGDNLTWAIREDGVLNIHCDGDMPNWNRYSPWAVWEGEQSTLLDIRQVNLTGNMTSIGDHAFYGMNTSLCADIVIPDTVTHIGDRAFGWCGSVPSIVLPENLVSIGANAFYYCRALTTLNLPEGLTTIGEEAFHGCSSLKDLDLPNSVETIQSGAFRGCSALKSITLGSNVSQLAFSAFMGSEFEEILVSSDNTTYCSVDGVLYSKDLTYLIAYPPMRQDSVFRIPYGVKYISDDAFDQVYGSDPLKVIYVPASVVGAWSLGGAALEKAWFYGDYPDISVYEIRADAETLTIFYPKGNTTWPAEELSDYRQAAFTCSHSKNGPYQLDPTCAEDGFSGTICYSCGEVLGNYQLLPATGDHNLGYKRVDNNPAFIRQFCPTCGQVRESAAIQFKNDDQLHYAYTGMAIEPAEIWYSSGWLGDEVTLSYTNNVSVGTATASIQIGGVTASKEFYIEEEANYVHGMCGENVSWVMTPDSILHIRGTGPMYDFRGEDSLLPSWTEYEWPENYFENEGDTITVIVEDGVTHIGEMTFYNHALDSVYLPDSVATIGKGAFRCYCIREVRLPEGLKTIPARCFDYDGGFSYDERDGLRYVNIPDSVTEIGEAAFAGTCLEEKIVLPAGLEKIGDYAFIGMEEATSIVLPANAEIGESAFSNSFTDFYVCFDKPEDFNPDIFYNETEDVVIHYASTAEGWADQTWDGITTELWPDTLHAPSATREVDPTCEAGYTLHYCERCGDGYRTDFVDPIKEHKLQYSASGDCIVETCQYGCSHYAVMTHTPLADYYVYTGAEIKPVTVSYSDNWLGGEVTVTYQNHVNPGKASVTIMYEATQLTRSFLITESSVAYTGQCGENVFWLLEENGTLTVYGSGPMYDYDRLEENEDETIPDYPEWLDLGRDVVDSIERIVIEEGVTSVGDYAFMGPSYVEEVSLPESLTRIGTSGFSGAVWLKKIIIPKNVTYIGDWAFDGCDLCYGEDYGEDYGVYFCGDAPTFGELVFGWFFTRDSLMLYYPCGNETWTEEAKNLDIENLELIWNPIHNYAAAVTDPTCIREGYTTYTCTGCGTNYIDDFVNSTMHYVVDGECVYCGKNPDAQWSLVDGTLIIYDSDIMADYPSWFYVPWFGQRESITDVVIHDGVDRIGNYAFCECSNLTSIVIPASVDRIGRYAFDGCSNLTSIVIPASMDHIGRFAFRGCSNLTSVVIPAGVDRIGRYTFAECSNLTSVVIPASVKRIDEYAFEKCNNLKEIVFAGNAPEVVELWGFYNVEGTIYYPCNNATWASVDVDSWSGNLLLAEHHDEVLHSAQAATCGESGWKAYVTCSRCDYSTYEAIDPLGHDEQSHNGKAATCGESGWKPYVTCSRCDYSTYEAIDPLGHDEQSHNGKAATCGESGWKAYVTCSRCDYTTYEAIDALGHDEQSHNGKAATCGESGWKAYVTCSRCDYTTYEAIEALGHDEQSHNGKAATCVESGWKAYVTCSRCDYSTYEAIDPLGHDEQSHNGKTATCGESGWKPYVTCSRCNYSTYEAIDPLEHKYVDGFCTVCGKPDPNHTPSAPSVDGVYRLAGRNRFDTAFKSADALKEVMGVEKFPAAIVTSGMNFADALAGSYLAAVTGAPILLTDNDNMADVIAYIRENVEAGGTVYALGGTAVVADTLKAVENSGYQFKRLAGSNRFATNLMILEEAGIRSGDPVLVCTAYNFADSLSASALGMPILLVDDTVSAEQLSFLRENADGEFILVGGTGAVKPAVETQLKTLGNVVRLAGNNRFDTSVLTAIESFGGSINYAVLAYGYNFPDGLCAGPLAYALGAPLILTANGDEVAAAVYANTVGITDGFVLGGPSLISDDAAYRIFSTATVLGGIN